MWYQNRRAKYRKRENTRKGPGRPAHNAHPNTCSGEPIDPGEVTRKERDRMDKKQRRLQERLSKLEQKRKITILAKLQKHHSIKKFKSTLGNSFLLKHQNGHFPISSISMAQNFSDSSTLKISQVETYEENKNAPNHEHRNSIEQDVLNERKRKPCETEQQKITKEQDLQEANEVKKTATFPVSPAGNYMKNDSKFSIENLLH